MSDTSMSGLGASGSISAAARESAFATLGNENSTSEEVNLAMLKFNEASAKFNAGVRTAQEEPNSIRRSTQNQQA